MDCGNQKGEFVQITIDGNCRFFFSGFHPEIAEFRASTGNDFKLDFCGKNEISQVFRKRFRSETIERFNKMFTF
jgi:hypothetical protein